MIIKLKRFSFTDDSTIGLLFVNNEFRCYTLEDAHRKKKIEKITCIPFGSYEITLRKEGKMHQRYSKRFEKFHQGMLWIKGVPNFNWIYLHPGNKIEHTDGCILTGDSINNNQVVDAFLGNSSAAYKRLYIDIFRAMFCGESIIIKIV